MAIVVSGCAMFSNKEPAELGAKELYDKGKKALNKGDYELAIQHFEKLESRYRKLLSEAHRLSQINRSQGDSKYAEAEAILDQIKALETES